MINFLAYRCYGTRQSLAALDKQKLNRSFESVSETENRSRLEKEKVARGEKKQKDLTGCLEKMTWDKTGLENEVRSYDSATVINWSHLAVKYGIKNRKGM